MSRFIFCKSKFLLFSAGDVDAKAAQGFLDFDDAGLADAVQIQESLIAVLQGVKDIGDLFKADFCPCANAESVQIHIRDLHVVDILAFFASLFFSQEILTGLQTAIEAVNLSFHVEQTLLLAGEERMTFGADFSADLFFN